MGDFGGQRLGLFWGTHRLGGGAGQESISPLQPSASRGDASFDHRSPQFDRRTVHGGCWSLSGGVRYRHLDARHRCLWGCVRNDQIGLGQPEDGPPAFVGSSPDTRQLCANSHRGPRGGDFRSSIGFGRSNRALEEKLLGQRFRILCFRGYPLLQGAHRGAGYWQRVRGGRIVVSLGREASGRI